jgi:hypothetical protein
VLLGATLAARQRAASVLFFLNSNNSPPPLRVLFLRAHVKRDAHDQACGKSDRTSRYVYEKCSLPSVMAMRRRSFRTA